MHISRSARDTHVVGVHGDTVTAFDSHGVEAIDDGSDGRPGLRIGEASSRIVGVDVQLSHCQPSVLSLHVVRDLTGR